MRDCLEGRYQLLLVAVILRFRLVEVGHVHAFATRWKTGLWSFFFSFGDDYLVQVLRYLVVASLLFTIINRSKYLVSRLLCKVLLGADLPLALPLALER